MTPIPASPASQPPATTNPAPTTTKKSHKSQNKSHGGGSGGVGGGTPFKTIEVAPAPRRKKRKFPENEIPPLIAAQLPESGIYAQLVELESKLDDVISRKKIEVQESVLNPPNSQKTLRIYVFNTYSNQSKSDGKSGESPSWTLKIIGRILDDGLDFGSENSVKGNSCYPKFSSFFKKITIYLDQKVYPDNHVILWENSRSPVLHEGFEVKRKGDKEFTAVIRLEMNYAPERFKLSTALTQVLGIEVETSARVMTALWQYVKVKKLQDPNDSSVFLCDPPLRKVFGEEKVRFAVAGQKLTQHLSPVQPVHLEHTIKLSGSNPSGLMCYDVLVDVPLPLGKDMSDFLEKTEKCKEIDDYDTAIIDAIKKINEHRRRWAFFLGFSQSPSEFINSVIGSQARDLKVVAGEAIQNAEKEHRAEFYNQAWTEDAVVHYLNRKTGSGIDPSGTS
ncbi:SWI/SNF complex component SNF12 homolog [Silene latifolia]|uniref:SWI/SNF complex component SNF12 homolog n=1 Tax=Silene latifolia TaxID=37657 RepID=UPI003D76C439